MRRLKDEGLRYQTLHDAELHRVHAKVHGNRHEDGGADQDGGRHIEEGASPLRAALVGSREIAFAVLAMTITLAAVYVPVALQSGRTGKLFTEFALTLAGAVLVSGFVALTLSPMMCSKFLPDREHEKHGPIYRVIEFFLNKLNDGYEAALRFCMNVRWLIVVLMLVVAGSAYWLFLGLKQELTPVEDRGILFASVTGPEGATLEYTSSYVRRMEALFAEVPELSTYFTVTGNQSPSQAMAPLRLKPWDERQRSSKEIAAALRKPLTDLPGVNVYANVPPSLGQSPNTKAAELVVLSTGSYEELDEVVQAILDTARDDPRLLNPDSDLKLSKPEIRLSVDRDKAAALVFGRVTYEGMRDYWTATTTEPSVVTTYMNALPKLVASRSQTTSEWNNTRMTDDIEGVAIYDASTSGNLLRVLRSTAHLVVAIGSQVRPFAAARDSSLGTSGVCMKPTFATTR